MKHFLQMMAVTLSALCCACAHANSEVVEEMAVIPADADVVIAFNVPQTLETDAAKNVRSNNPMVGEIFTTMDEVLLPYGKSVAKNVDRCYIAMKGETQCAVISTDIPAKTFADGFVKYAEKHGQKFECTPTTCCGKPGYTVSNDPKIPGVPVFAMTVVQADKNCLVFGAEEAVEWCCDPKASKLHSKSEICKMVPKDMSKTACFTACTPKNACAANCCGTCGGVKDKCTVPAPKTASSSTASAPNSSSATKGSKGISQSLLAMAAADINAASISVDVDSGNVVLSATFNCVSAEKAQSIAALSGLVIASQLPVLFIGAPDIQEQLAANTLIITDKETVIVTTLIPPGLGSEITAYLNAMSDANNVAVVEEDILIPAPAPSKR